MPGKRVQFDDETWHALDLLARDRMQDFQELADEAFRDLLQKHGRPTDLKTALRQSAGVDPVAETPSKKSKRVRRQLPAPHSLHVFAARLRPFTEPRNHAPGPISVLTRGSPLIELCDPSVGAPGIKGVRNGRPV
jgi:hypothetical protein